jgi:hypothetical protein
MENTMRGDVAVKCKLEQNRPNPFKSMTTFAYEISEPCRVLIEIYNVLGQIVATLVNEEQAPGYHSVKWRAANGIGSGMYFYRLIAASAMNPGSAFVQVRKMLLKK